MKYLFILILLTSVMLMTTANAQDRSTRFERQHHSKYEKANVEQTEEMLLQSLQSDNVGILASSAQTIRQLQIIFPDNPFSSLIDPLIKIIQDEKGDTHVRILSALALDDLHSDKGDKAIFNVSKKSNDKSVKDVCTALSVESFLASQK